MFLTQKKEVKLNKINKDKKKEKKKKKVRCNILYSPALSLYKYFLGPRSAASILGQYCRFSWRVCEMGSSSFENSRQCEIDSQHLHSYLSGNYLFGNNILCLSIPFSSLWIYIYIHTKEF